MHYTDLLPLFAQLAITITGFSGIVSIFGRDRAAWSLIDTTRLLSLLTASISAFVFSLIAVALIASDITEGATWRTVSALVVVERSVWLLRFSRTRSVFVRSKQTLLFFYAFACGNVAIVFLNVANATALAVLWPFSISIIWYLIESSWVFVRLVLFPIRNLRDEDRK